MKKNTVSRWIPALAVGALLWAAGPALAQDSDLEDYGDDYRSGDFGRVRYQENGSMITRAELEPGDSVNDQAGTNVPVFPGDVVVTGPDQRVEIQLSGGSLVRLDRNGRLTFLALPDPYAELRDHTVLQLASGVLRLSASLDDGEEFRIDTPASTIYLTGSSDVRVEVGPRGRTAVFSRRGVVEVVGNGGSVLVHGGMSAVVEPDQMPFRAEPFNTFLADGFDRWVEDREAAYRVRDRYADSGVYEEIPSEIRPYYGELSSHGNWVRSDDYGYVWYPHEVASDWRPYYDGYWKYGPRGYFWVSYEPWGWAPYHYGRWTWLSDRWCWVPGRIFAGAWVSWSWGSTYVGWSALDCWGFPIYRHHGHHGYDPYAWSFVSYSHLHHRHYGSYRVPVSRVVHLQDHALVTRPPRVAPGVLASSDEARKRAVRELHENRRHHVPGVSERAGRRPFDEREKNISGRGARDGDRLVRKAAVRGPVTDDARSPGSRQAAEARYPRRLTSAPGRSQTSPDGRERAEAGRSRGPREPGARDGNESARTPERVRDIYRRMSTPRQTRPQRREPETRAASPDKRPTGTQGSRPARTRAPEPKTPRGSGGEERKDRKEVDARPRVGRTGGIVRSSPRARDRATGDDRTRSSQSRTGRDPGTRAAPVPRTSPSRPPAPTVRERSDRSSSEPRRPSTPRRAEPQRRSATRPAEPPPRSTAPSRQQSPPPSARTATPERGGSRARPPSRSSGSSRKPAARPSKPSAPPRATKPSRGGGSKSGRKNDGKRR